MRVAGQENLALFDSGCGQSLITTSLIESLTLPSCNEVRINCIHGDIKTCPAKLVEIEIGGDLVQYKFGVVPRLPYPVVVGRDSPNFEKILKGKKGLYSLQAEDEKPREGVYEVDQLFAFSEELFAEPGKTRKMRKQKKTGCGYREKR